MENEKKERISAKQKAIVFSTQKLDETMKKISGIITDKILPNPQDFVTSSASIIEGKWIIKIDVLKGNALYYIKKYGRRGVEARY